MAESLAPAPVISPEHSALMFPTLTSAQIARIAAHGALRQFRAGETLIESGDQPAPFFVVRSGQVEIVRVSDEGETLVATHSPGGFTGEANLLLGRPALLRARAVDAGEAVELTRDQLLGIVQNDTEIGDIVMRGF